MDEQTGEHTFRIELEAAYVVVIGVKVEVDPDGMLSVVRRDGTWAGVFAPGQWLWAGPVDAMREPR